jgi:hypothetical protein
VTPSANGLAGSGVVVSGGLVVSGAPVDAGALVVSGASVVAVTTEVSGVEPPVAGGLVLGGAADGGAGDGPASSGEHAPATTVAPRARNARRESRVVTGRPRRWAQLSMSNVPRKAMSSG